MGIGIIGASSGATEALPFGAGALLTSGFVDGTTYDYTASVAAGRYVVEGLAQDAKTPIIAYAPNSNTTAVAYPGKSAILNVTQTESVIKFSAIPTINIENDRGLMSPNNGFYRTSDGAENANGTTIVTGMNYFDGSTFYMAVYSSSDSGASWTQVVTGTGNQGYPRTIKFIPENSYFLMSLGDNFIWRSADGFTWSQRQNLSAIYDIFNDNGTIYVASNNGVYRSTDSGQSYTQVYSGNTVWAISKNEVTGQLIGFNNNRTFYSNNGTNWTVQSYTNNNYTTSGGMQMRTGFGRLKNSLVASVEMSSDNDAPGAGFTVIGRDAMIKTTSYLGNTVQRNTNANYDGPENTFMVSNSENRGFVLAIGAQSGKLLLSTDGIFWSTIGSLPGHTIFQRSMSGMQTAKLENGRLIIPTQFTGPIARLTNRFAYKLYESAV